MMTWADIQKVVRRPRSRLWEAERRFFDAYSRGGDKNPRDLVIPITYFAHEDVAEHLEAWALGREPLDHAFLERAWREDGGREADAAKFYQNLSHFLSLM